MNARQTTLDRPRDGNDDDTAAALIPPNPSLASLRRAAA